MTTNTLDPIAYLLCTESVPLYRGGDFICHSFNAGETYPVLRHERGNAVMLNAMGGEHLMSPQFIRRYFKPVEAKQDDQTD